MCPCHMKFVLCVFEIILCTHKKKKKKKKVDANFVNSALFIFTRAKHVVLTYRPRAEDVERRIRYDLADAYETS